MEDKLVTLAILTYSKAVILKTVLENEGIETCIHNVNQIQPVVSSGVRVKIKECDLPKALKITESPAWLSDSVIKETTPQIESPTNKVLIPIDFSDYSFKACYFGFQIAKELNAEIILLHVYYRPIYTSSFQNGDVIGNIFDYQIPDRETDRTVIQKAHDNLNKITNDLKAKIRSGELPYVTFTSILREGVPEEEILQYSKDLHPRLIVMGTRGKDQKDIDLIGSVTAEVIDRARTTVVAIPENTSIDVFSKVKNIAFLTNFNQRDLVAFESFINSWKTFDFSVSLIHLADVDDTWNSIKLDGIRDYFHKQYPELEIHCDVVKNDNFLSSLEKYIKNNEIDAIALVSYRHNLLARMFNPSIAHKMLFHSDTLLIVIN